MNKDVINFRRYPISNSNSSSNSNSNYSDLSKEVGSEEIDNQQQKQQNDDGNDYFELNLPLTDPSSISNNNGTQLASDGNSSPSLILLNESRDSARRQEAAIIEEVEDEDEDNNELLISLHRKEIKTMKDDSVPLDNDYSNVTIAEYTDEPGNESSNQIYLNGKVSSALNTVNNNNNEKKRNNAKQQEDKSQELTIKEAIKLDKPLLIKSIRDWEVFFDPTTERNFFFHKLEGISQWEKPEDIDLSEIDSNDDGDESSDQDNEKKETFGDWRELIDKRSGRTYYYNIKTKESTWVRPMELRQSHIFSYEPKEEDWEMLKDPKSGENFYYNKKTGDTTWESPYKKSKEQQYLNTSSDATKSPPVPPNDVVRSRSIHLGYHEASKWEKLQDPLTGRVFFHHRLKGVSQWERPPELGSWSPPEIDIKPNSYSPSLSNVKESIDFQQTDEHQLDSNNGEMESPIYGKDDSRESGSESEGSEEDWELLIEQGKAIGKIGNWMLMKTKNKIFYLNSQTTKCQFKRPKEIRAEDIKQLLSPSASSQTQQIIPKLDLDNKTITKRVGYRSSVYVSPETLSKIQKKDNDKDLIQGYLKKRSKKGFRKWQLRYFTIYRHYLKYFKDENDARNDRSILASIDLNKIESIQIVPGTETEFVLCDSSPGHEILISIQASNAEERYTWIAALKKVNEDAKERIKMAPLQSSTSSSISQNQKELSQEIDNHVIPIKELEKMEVSSNNSRQEGGAVVIDNDGLLFENYHSEEEEEEDDIIVDKKADTDKNENNSNSKKKHVSYEDYQPPPPPPPFLSSKPKDIIKEAPILSHINQKEEVSRILALAIRDYHGPNSADISFRLGDRIEIIEHNPNEKWWIGKVISTSIKNGGKVGRFPSDAVSLQISGVFEHPKSQTIKETGSLPTRRERLSNEEIENENARQVVGEFAQKMEKKKTQESLVGLLESYLPSNQNVIPTLYMLDRLRDDAVNCNHKNHLLKAKYLGAKWVISRGSLGSSNQRFGSGGGGDDDILANMLPGNIDSAILAKYSKLWSELKFTNGSPSLLVSIGNVLRQEAQKVYAESLANSFLDYASADDIEYARLIFEASRMNSEFYHALVSSLIGRYDMVDFTEQILRSVIGNYDTQYFIEIMSRDIDVDLKKRDGFTSESVSDIGIELCNLIITTLLNEDLLSHQPKIIGMTCNLIRDRQRMLSFVNELVINSVVKDRNFPANETISKHLAYIFKCSIHDELILRSPLRLQASLRKLRQKIEEYVKESIELLSNMNGERVEEINDLVVVSCFELYMLHLAIHTYLSKQSQGQHLGTPLPRSIIDWNMEVGPPCPLPASENGNPYVILQLHIPMSFQGRSVGVDLDAGTNPRAVFASKPGLNDQLARLYEDARYLSTCNEDVLDFDQLQDVMRKLNRHSLAFQRSFTECNNLLASMTILNKVFHHLSKRANVQMNAHLAAAALRSPNFSAPPPPPVAPSMPVTMASLPSSLGHSPQSSLSFTTSTSKMKTPERSIPAYPPPIKIISTSREMPSYAPEQPIRPPFSSAPKRKVNTNDKTLVTTATKVTTPKMQTPRNNMSERGKELSSSSSSNASVSSVTRPDIQRYSQNKTTSLQRGTYFGTYTAEEAAYLRGRILDVDKNSTR